jgi:hypothetical protein
MVSFLSFQAQGRWRTLEVVVGKGQKNLARPSKAEQNDAEKAESKMFISPVAHYLITQVTKIII